MSGSKIPAMMLVSIRKQEKEKEKGKDKCKDKAKDKDKENDKAKAKAKDKDNGKAKTKAKEKEKGKAIKDGSSNCNNINREKDGQKTDLGQGRARIINHITNIKAEKETRKGKVTAKARKKEAMAMAKKAKAQGK